MDSFLEMQTAVLSDMTINSSSTLYPTATVQLAINRAYRKVGHLFRWPELEDAKKTSTVADQEYYDYPQNWRPDSAWKLTVDATDYGDPLAFEDYLYEQENDNPSGQTRMWSNQWRRFFIDPAPTTNGDNNIVIWGFKTVTAMSSDADVTIFSYGMPECNEAIVLEAVAILKSKGEAESSGAFRSTEAKQIVAIAWAKVKQERMKTKKTRGMLDVPDFFGNKTNKAESLIGRF